MPTITSHPAFLDHPALAHLVPRLGPPQWITRGGQWSATYAAELVADVLADVVQIAAESPDAALRALGVGAHVELIAMRARFAADGAAAARAN